MSCKWSILVALLALLLLCLSQHSSAEKQIETNQNTELSVEQKEAQLPEPNESDGDILQNLNEHYAADELSGERARRRFNSRIFRTRRGGGGRRRKTRRSLSLGIGGRGGRRGRRGRRGRGRGGRGGAGGAGGGGGGGGRRSRRARRARRMRRFRG